MEITLKIDIICTMIRFIRRIKKSEFIFSKSNVISLNRKKNFKVI